MSFRAYIRDTFSRPRVRPWALAAPVVVLILACPLLRPLRHPSDVSADESLRLATISALVDTHSLALTAAPIPADPSQLLLVNGKIYADQPPMLALLLSGPQWVMQRYVHLNPKENAALMAYVLTLLGVTMPVAAAAGLIYRMSRLFELPRRWRSGLSLAVVLGSGLISYAVVLNPHAPAAVLLLCSSACLIHVGMAKLPRFGATWITLAGICAALAAALDPPAGVVLILLLAVAATIRSTFIQRAISIALFTIGAAVPVLVHTSFSYPINGQIVPGWSTAASPATLADMTLTLPSQAVNVRPLLLVTAAKPKPSELSETDADDIISPPTMGNKFVRHLDWTWSALFGTHGLLSHFPVLLVGIAGIFSVMHRHWPSFVKTLAAATGIGAIGVLLLYGWDLTDFKSAMFATRWFVLFLPLLLFWSGAWLRRSHSTASWLLAGVLLLFSGTVAVVGMTEPYPRDGFDHYTAVQALTKLVHSGPTADAFARR